MNNNRFLPSGPGEETLDPSDWEATKELGQKMVADTIDFLKTIGSKPVWTKTPDAIKKRFRQPLPTEPENLENIYEEFREIIQPYYLGNIHPRFWGWVMGNGSVPGMLAEMLAAGLNSNAGIGDQAALHAENQVLEWCREIVGFSKESSGTLVSGASVANLNALIVARNSVNKYIRSRGIQIYSSNLVLYASTETHSSILKAAEIMGIGTDGVRKVSVGDDFKMNISHLEELIKKDKAAGNIPFCVVANVGTVNTGAIDPLEEIFLISMKYNLWFHIDGAFGALAKLLPEYDEKLKCIGLADSIAFDLHKWMHIPYEAGVVLIRDANKHRFSYALEADYLRAQERGVAAGPEPASNFGFELSRGFKALKVWMTLKAYGINKFKRLVRQNIQQARWLSRLIAAQPQLELMAPVSLNIVCFRFNPGMLIKWELNELNRELLMRLHEEGMVVTSYTVLKEEYCLRVAIVNHRSVRTDFDLLVKEVVRMGNLVMNQEGTGKEGMNKVA